MFHRRILFWFLKPTEVDLSDLVDITVDRASKVEICNMMLIGRGGGAWVLPAADRMTGGRDAVVVRQLICLPANA